MDGRLVAIRTVHSAIFLAELGSILWLVVTGIIGRRDRSVGVAAVLVAVESAVFVANDGICPLTPLAERYGASQRLRVRHLAPRRRRPDHPVLDDPARHPWSGAACPGRGRRPSIPSRAVG